MNGGPWGIVPRWLTLDARPGEHYVTSCCQWGIIRPVEEGWEAVRYASGERRVFSGPPMRSRAEAKQWIEEAGRGVATPLDALADAIVGPR